MAVHGAGCREPGASAGGREGAEGHHGRGRPWEAGKEPKAVVAGDVRGRLGRISRAPGRRTHFSFPWPPEAYEGTSAERERGPESWSIEEEAGEEEAGEDKAIEDGAVERRTGDPGLRHWEWIRELLSAEPERRGRRAEDGLCCCWEQSRRGRRGRLGQNLGYGRPEAGPGRIRRCRDRVGGELEEGRVRDEDLKLRCWRRV